MLDRDCYQPLATLAADDVIDRIELDPTDTIASDHRWPSIRSGPWNCCLTLLSDFEIGLGKVEETYIYRAITGRLNRHVRSSVERVIGCLKEFAGLDSVRVRNEPSSDRADANKTKNCNRLVNTATMYAGAT